MVIGIAAVPLVILSLAAIAMYVLTERLFDEAQQSNTELPSLGWLSITQFMFVVLTGAFALIQAVRHSHRVVGPAYRICDGLRRIRGGETGFRLEFRRGDELGAIADELNLLVADLERRQREDGPIQPDATPAACGSTDVH